MLNKFINWLAFSFAIFQISIAGFYFLPDLELRSVHIMFGFVLILMSIPFRRWEKRGERTKIPICDIILILIVLASGINIFFVYKQIFALPGESLPKDLILGALLALTIFEVCRRAQGIAIPLLTGLGVAYLFVAPYLPGTWHFRGLPVENVIEGVYYSSQGIYGSLTGLSATVIAIFIIFGGLLLHTGSGQTFIDIALKLAGRFRGGPAKAAIVASAMFGTISGNAVANTMVCGNYTIPLMKRLSYHPNFAAAVEAVASTGGHITPPIMASGAFIMAEFLGIDYIKIAFYAIIPAFLFYTCVFASVHFEALRRDLLPVPREEIPSWRAILVWSRLGPFFIPLALLVGLAVVGMSITVCGFWACVSAIVLYLLPNGSPSDWKQRFVERLRNLGTALTLSGKSLSALVPLFVCVNVLLNVLSVSGVTIKLSELVLSLGGTSVLGALIVSAAVPIILGMGIPGTAVYVISVAVVAGALLQLGFDALPVHMFLFYFASLNTITPPVCATVFVAAKIAGVDWVRVSGVSMRLALVGFLVPFFFVYQPALLLYHSTVSEILLAVVTGVAGAVMIAAGFFGYLRCRLSLITRLLYVASGILLLMPTPAADLIGVAVAAVGFLAEPFFRRAQGWLAREEIQ